MNTPQAAFICEMVASPDLRCALTRNMQLNDLVHFCTNAVSFSIFNLDPTFNQGSFNLTATKYCNTILVDKRVENIQCYGTSNLYIRRRHTNAITTLSQRCDDWLYPETREILCSGTDGETA